MPGSVCHQVCSSQCGVTEEGMNLCSLPFRHVLYGADNHRGEEVKFSRHHQPHQPRCEALYIPLCAVFNRILEPNIVFDAPIVIKDY